VSVSEYKEKTKLLNKSRDSSVCTAMGWTAGVRLSAGEINFSLLHSMQTVSGAHPVSYLMGTGVEWSGREANHSHQCSAEVKNGGTMPTLSH
jgi:hypothetical protein